MLGYGFILCLEEMSQSKAIKIMQDGKVKNKLIKGWKTAIIKQYTFIKFFFVVVFLQMTLYIEFVTCLLFHSFWFVLNYVNAKNVLLV